MNQVSKQSKTSLAVSAIVFSLLLIWQSTASAQTTPTTIVVSNAAQQSAVTRLGVNLGDQDYWDSGQMLKNLIFANSGFEAMKYRSIMVCFTVTANSCTDDNQYSPQPTGFWTGATYKVLSGSSIGATGSIVSSTKNPSSCAGCGQIIQFDKSLTLAKGDYFVVTNSFPGNGDAGWWDSISGGGTITSETTDLSPETPGKQAVLLSASGSGQASTVSQYFDNEGGRSFIQLNGAFAVTFRAKGVGGTNQLNVAVQRLAPSGTLSYLNKTLTLTNTWQDYTVPFSASETGSASGNVQLALSATGSNVELDDVSLEQTNSDPTNTTPFRDDVVNTLKELHPGTIRMMAAGAALGSDIPNQLQVPFARYREGFSTGSSSENAVPYGIHEFLQLCEAVGADPWITIPTATTTTEMADLIEYLTGTGSDPWSALRISRGQSAPWTMLFNKIHIELGNETWNGSFRGESMNSSAYPEVANQIFGAARATAGYQATKFDLVLDGFASSPGYNQGLLAASTQHDSMDVAPYLLYSGNNESQALMFGALFAEPEVFESAGGQVYQNLLATNAAPTKTYLNVYETNLSPIVGNITQAQLNLLTPSIGAGIAHTEHMLLMMRLGVKYQNAFSLPQYDFKRSDGSDVKLWGIVVDMGTTNLRRPQFQTQALANSVIGGTMLQTTQTGANPTWNQPLSSDGVQLATAHSLQSFAFQNGSTMSTVVFNLSQTAALPITFAGPNAPSGSVQMTQITSANITDNNETSSVVQPTTQTLGGFNPATPISLPPYSMTVFSWSGSVTQTPAFSVPAGTYTSSQTVAISAQTPGSEIHYTMDGTTPTTASPMYSAPVVVNTSLTLHAMAVASGYSASQVASAAYTVVTSTTAAPGLSVAAGTYSAAQTVTITDATAGAKIYYTVDGTTPTTASPIYSAPVVVSKSLTLHAMAVASGSSASPVTSAAYSIVLPAAAPVFSIAAGTYTSTQTVAITDATAGAKIYYTVNGTVPTTASSLYSAAITVSATETIKAIAVATNYTNSPVATALYTISPTAGGGINQAGGFAGSNLYVNGSAAIVGNVLQLTNGGTAEAGSAWSHSKVSVTSFTSDFDFQLPTSAGDGFTFTIQNAPKGIWALGNNASGLGYESVTNSVAVTFDLCQPGVASSELLGVYTGGSPAQGSSTDLNGTGINLHSGDPFHVHLVYASNTLTVTLTDKTTAATYTKSFTVNIPSSVGTSTAYVGFTGSTGAFTSTQNILDWTYQN